MSVLEKDFLTKAESANATGSDWNAERAALIADALRDECPFGQSASHGLRLRVRGESMLPTLWPGDIVEISPCSYTDIRPGHIALALRDGRLFLHRLISRTPDGFQLRGDSMPQPDPLFPPQALLGRLVRRNGGHKPAPASRLGFSVTWSRAAGMLLCYCGAARRLALKMHSRRKVSDFDLRDSASTSPNTSENTVELGAL